MAYNPTNWECGDVVTAEKLNKLEEAVEDLSIAIDGEGGLVITGDHTGEATEDQCPDGGTVFYTSTTWQEVYDAMHSQKVVIYDDGMSAYTVVSCSSGAGGVYRAFFAIPNYEDDAFEVGLLTADSASGQLYSLGCNLG